MKHKCEWRKNIPLCIFINSMKVDTYLYMLCIARLLSLRTLFGQSFHNFAWNMHRDLYKICRSWSKNSRLIRFSSAFLVWQTTGCSFAMKHLMSTGVGMLVDTMTSCVSISVRTCKYTVWTHILVDNGDNILEFISDVCEIYTVWVYVCCFGTSM
jgi:hypothetical protein